ncbi:MAG: hypothetical protein ABSD46_09885 [Bacteroidota bacterium]
MNRILVGLGVIFFCFSGCKKSNNPVDPPAVVPFDLSLGKTWTYAWSSVISDSTGKILNSETDSFQVRIASIHDTLKNYTELIRFEAQSIVHYIGTSKVWYQFAGDSLVEIAYNNAGATPVVLPKRIVKTVNDSKNGPAFFSLFPKVVITMMRLKGIQDTTIFRDDIRIVYKFPLVIGNRWTSFTYPFLQVREVVGTELIECAGKNFSCVKIKTTIPSLDPNIEWYDYVSMEGLIVRQIKIDNLVQTTSDSPDIVSYGHADESLELIQ